MNNGLPARRWGWERALLGLARAAPMIAPWLLQAPGTAGARRLEQRFHRRLAKAFGIEVAVAGQPTPGAGTLFVANHISWVDILVLGSVIDALFVSRHDVADWPVIGPLARRRGTLFVDRGTRGAAGGQAGSVANALRQGQAVILFPEGTTSDGLGVSPFRSSLFAAAAQAAQIQPVAIVYSRRDGTAFTDAEMQRHAWTDGEPALANAKMLARHGARATVHFLTPLPGGEASDRKQLAQSARAMIEVVYTRARPFTRSGDAA